MRFSEYDDWVDSQQLKARLKEIEQMNARQAQQAHAASVVLTQAQQAFLQKIAENPEALASLPVETLLKLAIACASVLPRVQQAERIAGSVVMNSTEGDRSRQPERPDQDHRRRIQFGAS